MTNFDIFAKEQDFAPFAEPAVSAELIYQIDPAACVLNCRRAMEAAVKWMYSVDSELVMPYQDNLIGVFVGQTCLILKNAVFLILCRVIQTLFSVC